LITYFALRITRCPDSRTTNEKARPFLSEAGSVRAAARVANSVSHARQSAPNTSCALSAPTRRCSCALAAASASAVSSRQAEHGVVAATLPTVRHSYREPRTFRRFFLDSLKRVSVVYPEAKLKVSEAGIFLSCNAREQRAAPNAIKYPGNTLRMSIVAAGTHEAGHAMRYDPQIASGFEQMELPTWREPEEFRRFIAGYIRLLPIPLRSDFDRCP
jgi:hypothetical protein